jgi:hypothetical protein
MAAVRHSYRALKQRCLTNAPPRLHSRRPFLVRDNHARDLIRIFSLTARAVGPQLPPKSPAVSDRTESSELPRFNLTSLGVTPRMRLFLIILLCIFGTIETFTWTILLCNHFYKNELVDEENDSQS